MKKIHLLLLVSAIFCSSLTAQHLIRVNNNTGLDADYTTLGTAVTNASNGDTIYMEGSSTSYDGTIINKKLTIIGPGYFLAENPKTQANAVAANFSSEITFSSGSQGSTMMGCSFNTGINANINTSDITIIRNHIYALYYNNNIKNLVICQNYIDYSISPGGGGTEILTNSVISNNIIQYQIVTDYQSGNIIISNNIILNPYWNIPISCFNSVIQNNIIASMQSYPIAENSGNTISYNLYAIDGSTENGNQYNIDMNSVFEDYDGSLSLSTDGKWKLRSGSPALGAGSGGADCGAFSGIAPYVLSGVPNLPHIYEINVPAAATTESGLHVTLKIKSGD
jgi:hypothetical protein